MGVPLYVIYDFSLVAFNILSLSLIFVSLITIIKLVCSSLGSSCLGLSVLPGLGLTVFFPCKGSFQLLSLQIFSQVLSLSLLLLGLLLQRFMRLMLFQRSLRLSPFVFILFSIFCSEAVISTILPPRSFICASHYGCLLV